MLMMRYLRIQRDLTMEEVGKQLDLSRTAVDSYELGYIDNPSAETRRKFEKFYGEPWKVLISVKGTPDNLARINSDPYAITTLKYLRLESDMTIEEFATMAGISQASLSIYERGKATPRKKSQLKLERYTGYDWETLMSPVVLDDLNTPEPKEDVIEIPVVEQDDSLSLFR